jgi:hypothetical protein
MSDPIYSSIKAEGDTMYLETGLGQKPKPRPKAPAKRRPAIPADRLLTSTMIWRLSVPFRKDFEAFRREVAKRIEPHTFKPASDIAKVDDPNREENEKRLKAIHDDLLKRDSPKLKEFDIVTVHARFYVLNGRDKYISNVEILRAE